MSNRPARGKARVQADAMEGLKAQIEETIEFGKAKDLQIKQLKKVLNRRHSQLDELEDLCEIHEAQLAAYREEVKQIREHCGLDLIDENN